MDFTFDSIYEALKNGESSEAIVKSFTDAMNAAEKQHKADVEEEARMKKAEDERKALDAEVRLCAAESVVDAIKEYYDVIHPDWSVDVEVDPKTAADILDSFMDIRKSVEKVFDGASKWPLWGDMWGEKGSHLANKRHEAKHHDDLRREISEFFDKWMDWE